MIINATLTIMNITEYFKDSYMLRYCYFILLLVLFSCNTNKEGQIVKQINKSTPGKVYLGYDAIKRTILPPLFVLLTNKE